MKVFVLSYYNYEDTEILDVFSEAAMEKKCKEFAEEQNKFNESELNKFKSQLSELYAKRDEKNVKRKELIHKAESLLDGERKAKANGDKSLEKEINKQRKKLLKEAENMTTDINHKVWLQELKVKIAEKEKYNTKRLADIYMSRNHLYFEEFYVLGMEE